MEIICHRGFWSKESEQNTLSSFKRALDHGFGIETDLRMNNDQEVILSHDLHLKNSVPFLELLEIYKGNNSTLALNIKTDGLSEQLDSDMSGYKITNYFFFDMSIPETLKFAGKGLKIFTRLSELEKDPLLIDESVGIWLDSFYYSWWSEDLINLIPEDKKICIVSPELHGREYIEEWAKIKNLESKRDLMLCTDLPNEAKDYFL